ncbi:MAG: glycosyltransferase [Patescibacteria group bacterium]|nr:glycosyltransferase [Patescibacteria group bacterium]
MKKIDLKNKKVALYNPFIETLGGGEKHIFLILDVFFKNGAEINVFWDKNISKELENRFPLALFKKIKWLPKKLISSSLNALKTLKNFDYFFYMTDGSYFFSNAKKNFVFAMVPDKKLYNLNFLNRLKLWNYQFISNSPYTAKWLKNWGINSKIITPYIEESFFAEENIKKEKIILSVARFFPHLHSKNQEKIIKTFLKLKNISSFFKDYKLILVGGLKTEDENYFQNLKSLAKNDSSIIFKPNISFDELKKLYKISDYFWHFTGLGVNEKKYPEQVEHFGIAPLEAMASGCFVFCHNSGGPQIIFENKEKDFLFNDEDELIKKMIYFEKNQSLKNEIINENKRFIKNNFNYKKFFNKVLTII